MDKKYRAWINLENVTTLFGEADVEVSGSIVECKSGPYVVPVNIVDKQVVFTNHKSIGYYIGVSPRNEPNVEENRIRYIPLTLKKNVYDVNSDQVDLLPVGFKGYLVCLEEGEEAMLVPSEIETAHFVPPPWSVRIKLQMVRDPLAKYGIVFRVTILDHIKVLDGTSKQFDLTLDKHSFVSAFYLSLAIEKQSEGKFCILSRSIENKKVMIDCEHWKLNEDPSMRNSLLAGFFTVGIFNELYKRNIDAKPLKLTTVQKRSKKIEFEDYLIENQDDNIFNEVVVRDYRMLNKKKAFEEDIKRKLKWTGNLIVFFYFLNKLFFFNASLIRGIKAMKQQFLIAPFAYQWSLSKVSTNGI